MFRRTEQHSVDWGAHAGILLLLLALRLPQLCYFRGARSLRAQVCHSGHQGSAEKTQETDCRINRNVMLTSCSSKSVNSLRPGGGRIPLLPLALSLPAELEILTISSANMYPAWGNPSPHIYGP